jgi:hypothetical protein
MIFELARINNQNTQEILNRVNQYDAKLQNLETLIPIQNELILWNGYLKQLTDKFDVFKSPGQLWETQYRESLNIISANLSNILSILSTNTATHEDAEISFGNVNDWFYNCKMILREAFKQSTEFLDDNQKQIVHINIENVISCTEQEIRLFKIHLEGMFQFKQSLTMESNNLLRAELLKKLNPEKLSSIRNLMELIHSKINESNLYIANSVSKFTNEIFPIALNSLESKIANSMESNSTSLSNYTTFLPKILKFQIQYSLNLLQTTFRKY